MAKFTGPKGKIVRRFSENIYGNPKFDRLLEKRNYPPGQHGNGGKFRRRVSDYGIHLREKQKLRYTYLLLERQFHNYFAKADKMEGMTGVNLLQILERRLDTVIYRMGFARTIMQSRQFVNHGHIKVNGKKVDIPSFLVKQGDVMEIREKSRNMIAILEAMDASASVYPWLQVDREKFMGTYLDIPLREQIPVNIDERLIVEYYSK
ncbi:MAG: 30S ribosomal protein S4 [Candidatus Cloacimonetes bacterium]|nr:30S ribosomal protein S4 [Candidatus Cloacimonadota bacterium]